MRLQEEAGNPRYSATAYQSEWPSPRKPGAAPLITPPSSPRASILAPVATSPARLSEPVSDPLDDWSLPDAQDTQISGVLRVMSLGHLCLGLVLALCGAVMEAVLHQPAFFGLAASGGILGACGLITLLALRHRQATSSSLAFYLLPYADFAIVGLWLLLFGVTSPMLLFYGYVVMSAALLLGNRHAIALGGIAGATILTIGLGEYRFQAGPAIRLPDAAEIVITILSAVLALGLIAAVARLFSANLDHFIALSNRQNEEVAEAHAHLAEQQQRISHELEILSDTYVRFMSGETGARVSLPNGSLMLAAHLLNTLLEQIGQLLRTSASHERMQGRVGEINQLIEHLHNGDTTAFQILGSPSGTALDLTALGLARLARQIHQYQQVIQQTGVAYAALLSFASELSLLRQTLTNTDTSVSELLSRSAQSAIHLHVLLDSESPRTDGHHSDRPLLQEMELRARQQSAGLEMVLARLSQIGAQIEGVETEMRRIAESIEQAAKPQRFPRLSLSSPALLEQAAALSPAQRGPGSGPLRGSDTLTSLSRTPSRPNSSPLKASDVLPSTPVRPASSALKGSDALPRRFNSPLTQPTPAVSDWLEARP